MIVYCLGMQSSGSTWLYNVVREILAANGVEHAAFRAEIYDNFHDTRAWEYDNAVLRAHNVESLLLRVLKLADVKAVLSYRDPRDAIASFMQRFGDVGAKFPRICNDAFRNLAGLLSASQHLDHISFFYEDGFTDKPDTVRRLAAYLELPLTEVQARGIFERYSTQSVKSLMASIDSLPEDRLFVDQQRNAMDRETSFHRTHISDGRVGKWRDVFDTNTGDALTEAFGDYARLLAVKATGRGRCPETNPDVRPLEPVSVTFASRLCAPMDDMDHFTRLLDCSELQGDLGIRSLDYLYLPEGQWDFSLRTLDLPRIVAKFCQNGQLLREAESGDGTVTFRYLNRLHDHPFDLHISYDGMADGMANRTPPPRVELRVTLRRDVRGRDGMVASDG